MDDEEKRQIAQHVEEKKQEIADHLEAQAKSFRKDLKSADEIRYGAVELPAEQGGGLAGGVGGAVSGVVNTAGEVVGGVASTGADVISGIGGIADAAHDEINSFFHNLRKRLGI